jgi:hypothetical protein
MKEVMRVKGSRSGRGLAWLVACLLLASPIQAVAQDDLGAPAEEDGSKSIAKFFDYGLCAVSIVAASTGVGAVMAVLVCGKAAYTWWTE